MTHNAQGITDRVGENGIKNKEVECLIEYIIFATLLWFGYVGFDIASVISITTTRKSTRNN